MEYRLSIDVRTALAVGAGPQPKGGVCPLIRDIDGVPRVPGSTLKGTLRTGLERLLRGVEGQPPQVCTDGIHRPCDVPTCRVCALFGTVGRAGVVKIGDGRIADEAVRAQLSSQRRGMPAGEIRTGQPLGRVERAPGSRHFAARETTLSGMIGLTLISRIEATRTLSSEEEGLLKAAARSVLTLGGGGSRGTGHVRLELEGPLLVREPVEGRWAPDMRIVLTAREPFSTTRDGSGGRGGNRALDHVPGTALRGALAGALCRGLPGGFEHPVLGKALGQGSLRVTDAIPSGRRVAPVTLVTCEAYPGFHLQTGPRVSADLWSHGAWDMLLVEFLSKRLVASRRVPWTGRCLLTLDSGPCPGRMVPLARPYVTERTSDEQGAPFATTFGHATVDRVTGRTAPRGFHARAVTLPIRGLSRYEGRIHGVKPEFAPVLTGLSQLRIGGALGTGHGLFGVRFESWEPSSVRPALEAVEEATAKLLANWPGGAVTRTEAGLERQRLAILDLTSDWVVRRWLSTPEETIAAELTSVPGIEVLEARLTVGSAGGFSTTAGLPRPLRRTFVRGGVVLISYQLLHENAVVEIFEKLTREGVGHLTEDGFGQVRVADPVHWERVPPLTEGR